jgi:hypothetical protein
VVAVAPGHDWVCVALVHAKSTRIHRRFMQPTRNWGLGMYKPNCVSVFGAFAGWPGRPPPSPPLTPPLLRVRHSPARPVDQRCYAELQPTTVLRSHSTAGAEANMRVSLGRAAMRCDGLCGCEGREVAVKESGHHQPSTIRPGCNPKPRLQPQSGTAWTAQTARDQHRETSDMHSTGPTWLGHQLQAG